MNLTRASGRLAMASVLLAGLGAISAFGQPFSANGTTTIAVTVAPEASIAITTVGNTSLTTPGGGLFVDYTGTTTFLYKIRTDKAAGVGHITLQITADFDGTGGPSVTTPPTTGDTLKYSCVVASGTACTGPVTAATSVPTNVATFGTDAHSIKAGDAGSVNWVLTNDPVYKTGSYNATATFTISNT